MYNDWTKRRFLTSKLRFPAVQDKNQGLGKMFHDFLAKLASKENGTVLIGTKVVTIDTKSQKEFIVENGAAFAK
jgi:hypothetical protein